MLYKYQAAADLQQQYVRGELCALVIDVQYVVLLLFQFRGILSLIVMTWLLLLLLLISSVRSGVQCYMNLSLTSRCTTDCFTAVHMTPTTPCYTAVLLYEVKPLSTLALNFNPNPNPNPIEHS